MQAAVQHEADTLKADRKAPQRLCLVTRESRDKADLIRFVVGPAASYITGQTIHSNGGAYMAL